MEFLRWPAIAVYLGTPVFLVYWWVKVARSGAGRRAWLMAAALAMWLAQAALLAYAILVCISGHCTPPVAEPVLLALMALAYAGIGWMLWLSRRTIAR